MPSMPSHQHQQPSADAAHPLHAGQQPLHTPDRIIRAGAVSVILHLMAYGAARILASLRYPLVGGRLVHAR